MMTTTPDNNVTTLINTTSNNINTTLSANVSTAQTTNLEASGAAVFAAVALGGELFAVVYLAR